MIRPVRLWKAAHSCSASQARAEGDEEAALAAAFAFALHDGLEGVCVGAADLVGLLHLDREPVVGEQPALARLGADGEDAALTPG